MGDWTSATYIASQIFVIVAYVLLASTYFVKNRAVMLVINVSSCVTMGVGFGLLRAWIGMGLIGVAICRDITSFILNKYRIRHGIPSNRITRLDCALLALWVAAITTITAFTFDGWLSLSAYFAMFIFTVAIWQKNVLVYKSLGVPVGALWILYNVVVKSLFGVILESVLLVAVIVGLVMYLVKNRRANIR